MEVESPVGDTCAPGLRPHGPGTRAVTGELRLLRGADGGNVVPGLLGVLMLSRRVLLAVRVLVSRDPCVSIRAPLQRQHDR